MVRGVGALAWTGTKKPFLGKIPRKGFVISQNSNRKD